MTAPPTLPELIAVTRQASNKVCIELQVPRELSWFEGHFPGCPLLPGVIQTTWAVRLAQAHLPVPARFRSLSGVKFMRFILPGAQVVLSLEFDAARNELEFEYREGGAVSASGTIGFEKA